MKKVLGVILELNPYHYGHQYFIEKAKEIVNPDITIAIISSSFMMRGDPMIMDKFYKTKLLLKNNIDLVIELPFVSGVNNSDYFCANCVNILNDFNVTDICFGSETNDIELLKNIINITNDTKYNTLLKQYLDKGYSYSLSSTKALLEMTNDSTLASVFSLPNNTLTIGYLKAINKTEITPHIISRIDNNYFDNNINEGKFNSATAIRNKLNNYENINKYIPDYEYNFYIPKELENNLYKLLQYQLLNINDYTNIKGINEGIENRLLNFIKEKDYDSFINNVKSKRYIINKIKRLILYILLNVDKKYENNYVYYLRVLGMNDNGKKYINSLPKDIKKQIITSFKNNDNDLVNIELKATKLYGIITNNYDLYKEEYNIPYRKEQI